MDTSETYIKMRLAAISDLGMGSPPELIPNIEVTWMTTVVFVDRKANWYYSTVDETVQLERQDQLQEMVSDNPYTNIKNAMYSMLDDLHKFAFNSNWLGFIPVTMEQLWLAFVMKEKYSKSWNGKDWINE